MAKMAKMTSEFKEKFTIFFKGCETIYSDYWINMKFIHQKDEFSCKIGRKYVKIICGNSVHTFIDIENGDVLKPANSKTPARHARGNIFDKDNGLKGMTEFGPYYLK